MEEDPNRFSDGFLFGIMGLCIALIVMRAFVTVQRRREAEARGQGFAEGMRALQTSGTVEETCPCHYHRDLRRADAHVADSFDTEKVEAKAKQHGARSK